MLRRVFSPTKMISIYGRSSAPPRTHNHFVPDGYIPPKSRQKIVSPPTSRPILKTTASSLRNNTPSRLRQSNPGSNCNCPPHEPPARPRISPHRPTTPRENLTKGASHPNQGVVFPNIQMPRSILKNADSNSESRKAQQQNDHDGSTPCPVGTPTRMTKSTCTAPHGASRGAFPAGSQKSCYVDLEYITNCPPKAVPMDKKVLDSLRRGPPSYNGSYMGSPISVMDKYDERDNPIWWKSMYPLGRRGPPAKSSLRPHARHPNILFDRVVTGQGDDNRTSCGASCSTQSCRGCADAGEDDQSEEEDSSWKYTQTSLI